MKIAVLSDIHANLPALKTVLDHVESAEPDMVVVGGDVINRGPQPRECLEIILDKIHNDQWKVLKGNHEDYVLKASLGLEHLPVWEQKVCAHTVWTSRLIPDYMNEISKWPDDLEIPVSDTSHLTCFHASKKGNRVGLYSFMADHELLDHVSTVSSAMCVGHTHVPFTRYISGKMVVNAGAVGLPFDGNPCASYALLSWSVDGWTAENIRLPYDRELTLKAMHDTGYLYDGGLMVPLIVEELKHSGPRLGKWHMRYEKSVAEGLMTIEDSIEAMLSEK